MEIRNIHHFIVTARLGSFTKAAGQLFISQSALSQSIKRLETELGVELFNRSGNAVHLTHAGQVFLPEASALYEKTIMLQERMKEVRENETEVIGFGISNFYSRYFLPNIIERLEAGYPELSVHFVEDISIKMEDMVLSGILDCALVPFPIGHSGLDVVPVRWETIYLAFPRNHFLADTPPEVPISLALTKNERFILTKRIHRFTALAMSMCENAGFVPNVVYETMNWDTVDSLIARGIGVGFVPDILAAKTGSQMPLYRKIDDISSIRAYALVRRAGRFFSPRAEQFFRELPTFICNGLNTRRVPDAGGE